MSTRTDRSFSVRRESQASHAVAGGYEGLLRLLMQSVPCDGAALWLMQDGRANPVAGVGVDGGLTPSLPLSDISTRQDWFGPGWDATPIRRQNTLLGAIVLFGAAPSLHTDEQRAALRDCAEACADLIELTALRERSRDQRRQADTRYRQLFERAHDAIYMTTRDGQFIDANPAMLALSGYTRDELLSLNAADLYANPADRQRFQKEVEKAGYVREHELQLRRKDGRIVYCLKSATVDLDEKGAVAGYQGILHDITERKREQEALAHTAFHDPLTGLPNRALLRDRLEQGWRYARRHRNYKFALMYMDLDRFKPVNDSLGHLVGDQLLAAVARRIERCVRNEDTVARLGGDEFAVMLDAVTDASHATRVAERILHELQIPFMLAGREIVIGASIGIALSMTGYSMLDHMVRDADTAMYRAKARGRNRYEVFDTGMHQAAAGLLRLENDLQTALQRNQFVVQYLPVFAMQDRRMVGVEALVRWKHPESGLLMPAHFMEVAEESGLIVPLGYWVLRRACEQLRTWQEQFGLPLDFTLSVNLSGRQLMQQDLGAQIDAVLKDIELAPQCLKLEMSEPDIMRNADPAVEILADLHERGVQLSIDDFGTGYSSLNYLHRFPLDNFKIDRSVVARMHAEQANSQALVRSILALGHSLNITAVGEGVETEAQFAELQELGVRYAQGFLLSRPVDADAVAAMLRAG